MYILEALCDLLFELSNDDRLLILFELQKEPLKLSNISKVLGFTPQATARNVARLVEIGLIKRTEESDYALTPYGSTSINLLAPYLFLTENHGYMSTHLTEMLPPQFLARIGELRNCDMVRDPLDMISSIERVFNGAEEWHYYMAPIRITSHESKQEIVDQLNKGVQIRSIEEYDYEPISRSVARMPKEELRAIQNHWMKGNNDTRYLDKITIRLFMSEKEVSLLSLPKIDGEVDLLGFTSSDPKFHSWCKDLFEYYWDRGKTKTTFWTQPLLDESA